MKKIESTDIVVVTETKNNLVVFNNFEELKTRLKNGLSQYQNITYSVENFDIASKNYDDLKKIKKALEDKKKQIQKVYAEPYADLEEKLNILIEMVKEPFKVVDGFIKSVEKSAKKEEILEYAKKNSLILGNYAEKITNSVAFFDAKWLNDSCRTKQWQTEVSEKIQQAACDMRTIDSVGGEYTNVLIARYIETLSLTGIKTFIENISENSVHVDETSFDMDEEGVFGYKVLKITATERKMLQVLSLIDLCDVDIEEIEDGMPKQMIEIINPSFDSFVAFDIEHTGTYGIDNRDSEAEIIEIGAVKVKNGTIIEKFDELCNPGRKITSRISRLTHITDSMLEDKPPVGKVIEDFKHFVGDEILVGHNIKSCDIPHIVRAGKKAGISFDNKFLDTKILANKNKNILNCENIKLTTLSNFFRIKQSKAHRAWCDAEANAYVYFKLKEITEQNK